LNKRLPLAIPPYDDCYVANIIKTVLPSLAKPTTAMLDALIYG